MNNIDDFHFVDETLLSSWHLVWFMPVLYITVLSALRRHVHNRSLKTGLNGAYDLNGVVIVHNIVLSVASACLFLAFTQELYRMISEYGFWSAWCDVEGRWTSGRIYYLLYINYILKYVELGDTVLLVLRGKPTPFLHVYHHAATLVLCLTQLHSRSSLQWLVVVVNLFVHIIMYGFYALHALKYDVWWKRYLTVLQIVQFVSVVVSGGPTYFITQFAHLGYVNAEYKCFGNPYFTTFGFAIILSYLGLFLKFYSKTYATQLPIKSTNTKKLF